MLNKGMEWLPLMEELNISGQEKKCLNESLTSMTWRIKSYMRGGYTQELYPI